MQLVRLATWMVCTTCSLGASYGNGQTLRILNWEAFLSEDTISQWEARTGASIEQIYFDNDENRNSLLTSYDQTTIDLVVIDQVSAPVFGRRGVLLPVSAYSGTPNLSHIDPQWKAQCGEYGTPYLWGTMGLAYRKDILTLPPSSWSALLNPAPELTGHIGLLEDYVDTLAPSLLKRGASVNTADESLLAEVFEELRSLLPAVLTFEYPITFVGSYPNADDLHLALAYSGDQYELNDMSGGDVWGYTIPEEGTVLWIDCLAVLANSPNKALAFDFINFINQPDVAAANSEAVFVATPNASALPLQSTAFRSNTLIYPDEATLAKSQHYDFAMANENVRLRNRITSSLVNIHESQ
ncbi:MAG: spermidine/putrescine ABC transporter substrate-binding protein [Gammaproteobacteria bacterium]|nr:spermidine/putrescine ABC transporter substrate-binding protein [Gammaproteobacteria bacterium]MDP2142347.1 spermidine/putrescine ABC transporter substrate-binding protein [Gammaproteobacteria bacterium]MDP2348588.1 spermidine/putrescine ABC transporter substrate-binding protein [Gammaproteobacteria bacterium]